MANQLDHNPWVVDTVMATPYKAYVKIRDITWDNMAAIGDALTILDMNGKIIIDSKASGINVNERFGNIGWVNGFQVTALGSGKVSIAI